MSEKNNNSRADRDMYLGLSDYIRAEVNGIVDEFAEFARDHLPSAKRLTPTELRDTAADLLRHVADDMESRQSEAERSGKSRGDSPQNSPPLTDDARSHARDRLAASFSMTELMSEFRALRANVLRRWRDANVGDPATAVEEVVRFDEAIDQALTESIAWYASQTDRSRELMSGMIAHDLRNPLGAIVMSAHYLLRSDSISGPEMKAAGRILSSATTMEKLVGDLLDFTQVRMGGNLGMTPVNTSLREICTNAVEELRAFHPDRTIDVDVRDSIDGYWDRNRLHQVISNLIANALGHGAADSPVTVSAATEGACMRLDVHNLGDPIPAESLSDIFDPLKRLPRTGPHPRPSTGGVGLGLFIVKEVAQAHGGSVTVASSREAGTTFTVRLPRTPSAGGAAAELISHERIAAACMCVYGTRRPGRERRSGRS